MTLHAIQTGFVRIKRAQVEGHERGLLRRLAVFADTQWTDWLPTYAWIIDHPEVRRPCTVRLRSFVRHIIPTGRLAGR